MHHAKPLPDNIWAFIWHYWHDKRWALAGYLLIALIWAIEMSASPYFMKMIVDTVVQYSADHAAMLKAIVLPSVLYASMTLLLTFTFRLYDFIGLRALPAIKSKMTQDMFEYLLRHSHRYFQDHFAGTLTKKIFDMVVESEKIITTINDRFIPRAFALIIASWMLWEVVEPLVGIILFIWTVLFIAGASWAGYRAERYAHTVSEYYSTMSGYLSDSISNIMSTKLFYRLSGESQRIEGSLKNLVDSDRRLLWFNLKTNFCQGIAIFILTGMLLKCLIDGAAEGRVTPGDFAMVLNLVAWMCFTVWDVGANILVIARSMGICRQALSFIMEPHEVVDAPNAKPLEVTRGEITFNDVSHQYPGSEVIFSNLSVTIQPGEKVGLVGYSGGGKSTFMRLILRLMDIKSGEILIDGQNIAQVTKASLRSNISTIPQETEMFHRSILDNIRFARPEATDEEVIDAAQKACCDEFINALPSKYDSIVGERGVKLSGGQRQRIAIARAFLKNAPILLLDEATSALDTATERLIQRSLHEVMAHKTTIVIAHRLSTLKDMDRILFFENGQIVEQGSLGDLLNNPEGKFYQLWHMQHRDE